MHRNDAVTLAELRALEPDAVLVSPGPGQPRRARRRRRVDRRHPRLRRGRRPGARRLLRSPVHRPDLRRPRRAGPARDARQDVADHPRRSRRVPRLPTPFTATRYHSLVVERDVGARRARDQRRVRRRPGDGPAPPRPPDRGRAVPPRVDPHRGRSLPARQLPRRRVAPDRLAQAAADGRRAGRAPRPRGRRRPTTPSASASSSAAGAEPVAQPGHHLAPALPEAARERRLAVAGLARGAGRASRTAGAAGTRRSAASRGRHRSAPTSMSARSRSRPRSGRPMRTDRGLGRALAQPRRRSPARRRAGCSPRPRARRRRRPGRAIAAAV